MADHHEHVHGSMDIRAQEYAFNGFVKMVTRGAIFCLVALVLLALINA